MIQLTKKLNYQYMVNIYEFISISEYILISLYNPKLWGFELKNLTLSSDYGIYMLRGQNGIK